MAFRYEEDRAVMLNLAYDHRINQRRETAFHNHYGTYGVEPLHRYHEERIRFQSRPDFVMALNDTNECPATRTSPTVKFVNILDLHGLLRVVEGENYSDPQLLTFQRYCTSFGTGGESKERLFSDWLDRNLLDKDDDEQRQFVGRLLQLVGNMCRTEGPFNPIWVTYFAAFKEYLGSRDEAWRADRWQRAVGLAKNAERWLAVVRYSFAELGRKLYRPTQLDAGAYPYHFPSHPRRAAGRGGQAMAIGEGDFSNRKVLPEFIHVQVDCLTEKNVLAVAKTMATSIGGLVPYRLRHRERLRSINPSADDSGWYPPDQIDTEQKAL